MSDDKSVSNDKNGKQKDIDLNENDQLYGLSTIGTRFTGLSEQLEQRKQWRLKQSIGMVHQYDTSWLIKLIPDGEWKTMLKPLYNHLLNIQDKLDQIKTIVYPPRDQIFRSLLLTPPSKIKIVIVGQDPYHDGSANGLAFSVSCGKPIRPSLMNIFKKIQMEYIDKMIQLPSCGNLDNWNKQGVFLLNTTLTVNHGQPGSHSGFGWNFITGRIIRYISDSFKGIVFLLWGSHAKSLASEIDPKKHHILTAAHPSTLSERGFFSESIFIEANKRLLKDGKNVIDWLDTCKCHDE